MEKNETDSIIEKNNIFHIGNVCSVDGRDVNIKIDLSKNLSHLLYKGELIKNVAVGGYLKIAKGFVYIIGKVDKEFIIENDIQGKYYNRNEIIERHAIVKLIGYIENNKFQKGIKEMPLIENDCYLLDSEEFNLIHRFAKEDEESISFGHLVSDNNVEISLGIDSLFSSHIGIFGNTGSGKSYTLAQIYHTLFEEIGTSEEFKKHAKFVFFDFNGEYSKDGVICPNKKVYKVSTINDKGDKLPLSENDMLKPELFYILASATEKTQQPFIARAIKYYVKVKDSKDKDAYFKQILCKQLTQILGMKEGVKGQLLLDYFKDIIKVDNSDIIDVSITDDIDFNNTNNHFVYKLASTHQYLDSYPETVEETKLYKYISKVQMSTNFISKIVQFLYIQLIYDVISNRAMNEHIAPAINKLISIKDQFNKVINVNDESSFWAETNCCIVDMNNANTNMKKLLPLLISVKLYNEHKKLKRKETTDYLDIIIDEAHNILSFESQRESEAWKDYRLETFEEIIKEGRKFGVFMTIASQRPSDISGTIVSQLHNFFIHRLVNDKDLSMVANNISYLDKTSVESLPILGTGTCVMAGVMSQMPIVLKINKLDKECRPQNETFKLSTLVEKKANK